MKLVRNCPECKSVFRGDECSCGWKTSGSNGSVSDDKCSYIFEGRRCPLFGTRRNNSAWYCSGHLAALGDYYGGRAALKFAEENYAEIIHELRCLNDLVSHIKCERCRQWNESKKTKMAESKNYSKVEKRSIKPVGEFVSAPRRLGTALLPIVQPWQNLDCSVSFKDGGSCQ